MIFSAVSRVSLFALDDDRLQTIWSALGKKRLSLSFMLRGTIFKYLCS